VRKPILDQLNGLADEDEFRLRLALIRALSRSEAPEAVAALEKIRALDTDGRVRREATVSRDALLTSGTLPESVSQLREALGKLEEDYRKLRSQVEEAKPPVKAC
jgi:hypothetical protein